MSISDIDVKALRSANNFVFRHLNKRSVIEAFKRDESYNDKWRHTIEVMYTFRDYSEKRIVDNNFKAFHMDASYNECLMTIFNHIIKEGDSIILIWERGAMNHEASKEVNFVGDKLKMEIIRHSEKTGKDKKMFFEIESQMGYDNSARMIKPA